MTRREINQSVAAYRYLLEGGDSAQVQALHATGTWGKSAPYQRRMHFRFTHPEDPRLAAIMDHVSYLERHNDRGLKVGDRVFVTAKPPRKELGGGSGKWKNNWITGMDKWIGCYATIIGDVQESGFTLEKAGCGDQFDFPYMSLVRIPPSVEEHPRATRTPTTARRIRTRPRTEKL